MKNFKESGIEWLGEIPEHWEVVTLKYLVEKIIGGGTPDTSNLDYWTNNKKDGYLWVSIEDITKSSFITDTKRYITQDGLESSSAKLIPPFSILYSIYASLGKIAYSDQILTTNQAILGIQSNHKLVFYKFLFYCLCNTTNYVTILSSMTTQNNISLSVVANLKIPVPPLKEQEQIANFLDEKCEQIANFIEKKEKLITLLKEQKQALINETITKGLDKNVNFKDSGIEWLGEIPQHWEIKKLKMLFILGNGLNITKADFVSYGIPCVSYGEIHSKYPCRLNTTIHTLPFVSKTYLADKPQSLLQKGDFVFADTSEDIEGSGNFTSIQSDTPIFAGYHTIILKYKGKINSLYFSFLFDSIFTRNQIRKEVCGVKVFSITKSILKEVQCLIPSLKEQEQIANFLDEKCGKIDLLIEKTEKQIKLIKEYKTTLINQAVCGRINN
ncbi:TPA: restriction endonuclease subunit S [Campylobacter jejuni]|uniref:restriction endonuclease subunit S n=1 Tax=Campylobacter sp. CH186 TaxID=2498130 RepID=UPI001067EB0C|nr:restriction endonuclease subunit S [Campylobacter sp. CH186]ECR1593361.1 restriction endonuclease subunit S [Campylobacter jejuni]TEY42618.1 restriction endonuclease subunit S [Campylobacter sp. CH185]ECR3017104.1 restriction endonuclease subunit S [Campylobacter jejuni]EDP6628688.1 restriction endonuclease subunit S [Campylobacter jejuni]TEX83704.1 restriction endonuclease subunit S [Campylobacter sp. CH186]